QALDPGLIAPAGISKSLDLVPQDLSLELEPGEGPIPGRLFLQGCLRMKTLARLVSIGQGVKNRWRNLYFRLLGVRLQGYVWMRDVEIPRNYEEIELAGGVALDRGVVLLCSGPPAAGVKIRIGAGTYINRHTMLDATERLEIGKNCA